MDYDNIDLSKMTMDEKIMLAHKLLDEIEFHLDYIATNHKK